MTLLASYEKKIISEKYFISSQTLNERFATTFLILDCQKRNIFIFYFCVPVIVRKICFKS